jgi:hypothetical protein
MENSEMKVQNLSPDADTISRICDIRSRVESGSSVT